MTEPRFDDKALYDSIVHGLRSRGWSRIDAELEALEILARQEERDDD